MEIDFKQKIELIKKKYCDLGYNLGWSFLASSKKNLEQKSKIMLITLNPGGNKYHNPVESFEDGNIYCDEDWRGNGEGKDPLQVQIKSLFRWLVPNFKEFESEKDLMDNTLMGCFIPFRSPNINSLPKKYEAILFAKELWGDIITELEPSLLITIDVETFSSLKIILTDAGFISNGNTVKMPTGWGKINSEIIQYSKSNKKLTLFRLPHLSRFKIFNRGKDYEIKKIIKAVHNSL